MCKTNDRESVRSDTKRSKTYDIKSRLHPRNKHRERYNFRLLIESYAELSSFVKDNKYGDKSIDFSDPKAVLALNKALLKHYYGIIIWDIPDGYLCPPIPGRADYIHHIAQLLSQHNFGKIPTGKNIKCLDIGVGANCVYPIIGNHEYGWSFIGSDIDAVSLDSAQKIVDANPTLSKNVELRYQKDPNDIFFGLINEDEKVDLTICNPPFHGSVEEAQSATTRKLKNLNLNKEETPVLNFGGQNNELWCKGGEQKFVLNMIRESRKFSTQCFWFSTLISKQTTLKNANKSLVKEGAVEVVTLPMGQGNKTSRVVVWTFMDKEEQKDWIKSRWKNKQ